MRGRTIIKIIATLILIWALLNIIFNPIFTYGLIWAIIAAVCLVYILKDSLIALVGTLLMLISFFMLLAGSISPVVRLLLFSGIASAIGVIGVIITITGLTRRTHRR